MISPKDFEMQSAPATAISTENLTRPDGLIVFAISMIRNEADLIAAILSQARALFDHYIIVDVQSTDGTSEIIEAFAKDWPHVTHLKFRLEEKHQSAMMNALARRAADAGADWVFFLDSDEFLDVADRDDLEQRLRAFPFEVMHMPWINLVPSRYGEFERFETDQDFRWSGRVHELNKVAVSAAYLERYPSFNISEGNHAVSRAISMQDIDWDVNSGIPLLHVPVRSVERLRYKIGKALATLRSKHYVQPGEGFHVIRIAELLSAQQPNLLGLNAIAASYSMQHERTGDLDVEKLRWPIKRLPAHCKNEGQALPAPRSAAATSRGDMKLKWKPSGFARNSLLRAYVDGDEVKLAAQPVTGGGKFVRKSYAALTRRERASQLELPVVAEAIYASMSAVNLVPGAQSAAIAALLALEKPRRFVDLDVGDSGLFQEMCVITRAFNAKMNCIAVGAWDGLEKAYGDAEFASLSKQLQVHFPAHHVIRANTADAIPCFEDASIDLLRLPGYASCKRLAMLIKLWRPKLASGAVILLPQIEVHDGEAEAWRFWEDLDDNVLRFSLPHDGGLGFFTLPSQGDEPALLELLNSRRDYVTFARRYFGDVARAVNNEKTSKAALTLLLDERDKHFNELSDIHHRTHGRLAVAEGIALNLWKREMTTACEALRASKTGVAEVEAILRESRVFDAEYYLRTYPDIAQDGVDPLWHYIAFGAAELRMPNHWFDPARYLLANEDVMLGAINPLLHFVQHGRDEGRPLS